jgi:DNA-directed RNA polymerase specialized sigma24 family protein
MAGYDLAWAYSQAYRSVSIYVADKPALEPWVEDLVQLVVWRAWAASEAGHKVGRRAMWLYTVRAASTLFGDGRYQGRRLLLEASSEMPEHVPGSTTAPRPEVAIALWRLRDKWDDLTELQQEALRCELLGESFTAAAVRLGTTQPNLWRALQGAIGRLDGRIKRGRGRAISNRHQEAA